MPAKKKARKAKGGTYDRMSPGQKARAKKAARKAAAEARGERRLKQIRSDMEKADKSRVNESQKSRDRSFFADVSVDEDYPVSKDGRERGHKSLTEKALELPSRKKNPFKSKRSK